MELTSLKNDCQKAINKILSKRQNVKDLEPRKVLDIGKNSG